MPILRSLKIAFFLGYKSITKGNKATAILMVFILSLAFINQVFIAGILNGIVEAINKQFVNNMVSNIIVDPQEEPTRKNMISGASRLQEQIETIPGVVATARHYKMGGTIFYDKEKNGKPISVSAQIVGIDPEQEKKISGLYAKIIEGRYLESSDRDGVVIGVTIAGGYGDAGEFRSLGGVKTGETIKIAYAGGFTKDYKVRGIYRAKFEEVDMGVFISAKEAEAILSVYDSASQILVKTQMTGFEKRYIKEIEAMAPNLKVREWSEYMGGMGGINESFGIITLIISAIGVAVAGITIFILIYINAVNKRRQIGILKAIGISENIIICSYVLQALFYSVTGTAIGLMLAVFIVTPYFAANPIELPIGDSGLVLSDSTIFYSALSMLVAGLIAGFIPAWQTARENILKAIWGT